MFGDRLLDLPQIDVPDVGDDIPTDLAVLAHRLSLVVVGVQLQIRPAEDGLVLQPLLYAAEVRSLKDLDIERTDVAPAELKLAIYRPGAPFVLRSSALRVRAIWRRS